MLRQYLDGQLGIGAKRFRQDGLRLFHLALEREGAAILTTRLR
jgi:hypothetical protein